MNSTQQKEYLNKVRSDLQSQMIQDLVTKISDNCFKVCAGTRGEGLDASEKLCLGHCMGRYMDAMKVVHESIESRQR